MAGLKQDSVSGVLSCECGNRLDLEGFYPCDSDGWRTAASELVCCDRCGRITERATGKCLGFRSFSGTSSEAPNQE